MGVIEDIKAAISSYPTKSVDVTVTSYALLPSQGTTLNKNELFKFKIKVQNTGCLNMNGVKVKVEGTSFATVATASGGAYSSSATSSTFSVPAFGSYETGYFYGKATAATSGAKTIVTAKVEEWDANLDYLLNSASMAGPSEGKLDKDILSD